MKKIKYYLVFVLMLGFMGCNFIHQSNFFSNAYITLGGIRVVITSLEELYVTYYTTKMLQNLEDYKNGKIDNVTYEANKAKYKEESEKVIELFDKIVVTYNSAIGVLELVEQGSIDKRMGRIQLQNYMKELNNLIADLNKLLIEFGVLKMEVKTQ